MTAPAADASEKTGFLAKFAPFPRPFWVINGVELFERGAYYGMLSVLSVFIARDLQFPPWLTGVLLAIQFPLLYFLPVASGAMAEKFGFRKLLVATFAFLIGGYLALSVATTLAMGLLGIVLFGVGAGLFKPMPAAAVTYTTSEKDRNFGFAIYYWMINLGAFLAPIGMQQAFGGGYRSYFVVSAALSVLNLVICLFMWRDIREPKRELSVVASLKSIGEIVRYPSFAVLILIYSGFWFMYAITTSYLQIYAVQQGILLDSQVALLVPANALAILVAGPVISKLTGKFPSLPLMIAGITVFCAGFLLIGFVPTIIALFTGVLVFSIGEFLTHPSYLAYVSKISPPERVPVFLGYGFIAIGIGQFAGTFAGGFLYQWFATDGGRPQMFWVAIVAVGLLTVAALIVYNLLLTARRVPAAQRPARRSVLAPLGAAAALLVIPALVAAAYVGPADGPVSPAGAGGDVDGLVSLALDPLTGEAKEGEAAEQVVTLPANATGVVAFTLTWSDEAAASPALRNAPDAFTVHVFAPNGTKVAQSERVANPVGGEGKIELKVEGAVPGDWVLHVEVESGDQSPGAGPLSLPVGGQSDTGNAFALAVTTQAAR